MKMLQESAVEYGMKCLVAGLMFALALCDLTKPSVSG